MSLNQICSNICDNLERAEKFSQFQTDKDRIRFCHEICKNYVLNFNFKRTYKSCNRSKNLYALAYETFHKKNQKLQGLKLITESVANAESKIYLRQAFKNRSDFLISFKYYDEASVDMFNALSLVDCKPGAPFQQDSEYVLQNYDKLKPESSPHLIGRGNIAPLSGGNDSFFESASKSIGLKYSDFWERELVAKNDIKTGEVLIVEKPYASVLLPSHFYTHCSHCFSRCFTLIPCSKCCFAMFCCESCEKKSLESYHKIECNIMDILVELKVERMQLLSLRILLCASNQGKDLVKLYQTVNQWESNKNNNSNCDSITGQSYKSSDFMNIYNLVTNSEKRSASDLFYRSVVSSILINLLAKYTEFFRFVPQQQREFYEEFCVGLVFRFMQSLPCNAHEISELGHDCLEEIGAGIYATLSLINHSCDPNVVRYCCGDAIVLRAIKPIKKNEQILDNYGYHYATHSLSERQDSLKKQYYFKCECEACIQHWPQYEKLPKEKVQFKKKPDMKMYKKLTDAFEKNLKITLNGNFTSQIVQQFTHYLDYLHEFVILPWQDFNNCQEAIKHCWSFEGNHFRYSKAVTM